ncbi:putative cilia- and flagella-associated protein 57 [Paratrimastix pyriformis]|uniref:Cilia- and flagella-associated protein 57 n=1 Tax=Paratrimastix pyriformis TaxID=342808 RepID=A0ABQ8UP30_9EUKA|nr:putative cilia- and flagella-associated protein 57 [Paratrimastix pyriformis]
MSAPPAGTPSLPTPRGPLQTAASVTSFAQTGPGGAASANFLTLMQSFGIDPTVRDGIHTVSTTQTLYVAGHNAVLFTTQPVEEKAQLFFSGSERGRAIRALAVSPSKRCFAIAEEGGSRPLLTVYPEYTSPWRRFRQLAMPTQTGAETTTSRTFVCLALSRDTGQDARFLAALSGAPEFGLYMWHLDGIKMSNKLVGGNLRTVAATTQLGGNPMMPQGHQLQITFNPIDPNVLCVTGPMFCRFFNHRETQGLKPGKEPFSTKSLRNFTCHCWLSGDRVLVCSEEGDIFSVENGDNRGTVIPHRTDQPPRIICPTSKGFVVALDGCQVAVFEHQQAMEREREFMAVRTVLLQGPGQPLAIASMSLQQSNPLTLLVLLTNGQLATVDLSQAAQQAAAVDPRQAGSLMLGLAGGLPGSLASPGATASQTPAGLESGVSLLRPVLPDFHSGTGVSVNLVATCLRKPLLATCGSDQAIAVLNMASERSPDRPGEALAGQEINCLCIHPTGLHLLVGFGDRVRLLNIIADPQQRGGAPSGPAASGPCPGHGGHLFAAVYSQSINIYSTYTGANMASLHSHSARVRDFVSCGSDGAIHMFSLATGVPTGLPSPQLNVPGMEWTHLEANADFTTFWAIGADRRLHQFDEDLREVPVPVQFDTTPSALALTPTERCLLVGFDTGLVRCYKLPLTDRPGDVCEVAVHRAAVRTLACAAPYPGYPRAGSCWVASGGADGALYTMQCFLDDKIDKELQQKDRDHEPFSEEILANRTEMEEQLHQIAQLEAKLEEMREENKTRLRKAQEEFDQAAIQFEAEESAKQAKLRRDGEQYEENRQELLGHFETVDTQMTQNFDQECAGLPGRALWDAPPIRLTGIVPCAPKMNEDLKARESQLAEDIATITQEIQDAQTRDEDALAEMTHEFAARRQRRLAERDARVAATKAQTEELRAARKELLAKLDEDRLHHYTDADLKYLGVEDAHFTRYRDQMERGLEAEKRLRQAELARDRARTACEEKDREACQKLLREKAGLTTEMDTQRREIAERTATIGEKTQRELEKFKFVLDWKILELQAKVAPRDWEIKERTEEIKERDQELERYKKQKAAFDLEMETHRLNLSGMQIEMGNQSQRNSRVRLALAFFFSLPFWPPRQRLEAARAYVGRIETDLRKARLLVGNPAALKRKHLESNVYKLRQNLSKGVASHRADIARIMHENVTLVKEINLLNRDKRTEADREPEPPPTTGAPSPGWPCPVVWPRRAGPAVEGEEGLRSGRLGADVRRVLDQQAQELLQLRTELARLQPAPSDGAGEAAAQPSARLGEDAPSYATPASVSARAASAAPVMGPVAQPRAGWLPPIAGAATPADGAAIAPTAPVASAAAAAAAFAAATADGPMRAFPPRAGPAVGAALRSSTAPLGAMRGLGPVLPAATPRGMTPRGQQGQILTPRLSVRTGSGYDPTRTSLGGMSARAGPFPRPAWGTPQQQQQQAADRGGLMVGGTGAPRNPR